MCCTCCDRQQLPKLSSSDLEEGPQIAAEVHSLIDEIEIKSKACRNLQEAGKLS